MIKTLRITSVAAVILAGVVLASVVGPASLVSLGTRDNALIDKIMGAPSAVDRFNEQYGDKVKSSQDTTSPLVRQAELFKEIIDPRVQPSGQIAAAPPRGPQRSVLPTPPASSAKFKVLGTSYAPANPEASFAYIELPDTTKTCQWVQPGDQVGHFVIKEIRSGSVVCSDGRQDIEEVMVSTPDTASVLETGQASSVPAASASPGPIIGTPSGAAGRPVVPNRPVVTMAPSPSTQMNEEEQRAYGDLVERLKELQNRTGSGAGGSELDPAARAAAVNKLISEFRSSRVSAEEAEKLGDLGERLNSEDKEASRDERRREFLRRLSAPRPTRSEPTP